MKTTLKIWTTIIISMILFALPLWADSYTWLEVNTPDKYSVFSNIDNHGENLVWATCTQNYLSSRTLIYSSDGGKNWSEIYTFTDAVQDLDFISENVGFAICFEKILKTNDGGNTWNEIYSGIQLTQLSVVSESVIWAAATKRYVIRTTDSGNSWNVDTLTTMDRNLLDISAINTDNAWVILEDPYSTTNVLYKTSDAGSSWQSKSYKTLTEIELTSSEIGYALFDNWLWKTTNFSSNWTRQRSFPYGKFLHSAEDNKLWIFNRDAYNYFYKTADGGETWVKSGRGFASKNLSFIYNYCAHDTSHAWAGDSDDIYKYVPYPNIDLLYPNAGDNVHTEETIQILWGSQTIEYINIYYTSDGSNWTLIEDSVETATGSYYWQTPTTEITDCKIKLEPCNSRFSYYTTESDGNFSILASPISYKDFDLYNRCDFSENNPLNVFEKGVPIRIKVKVKNNLTQNLLSASGTLSSDSPYINITSNTTSYNNILSNGEEWSSNEFEFIIQNNAPNEFTVDFELNIDDQIVTGGPWACNFSLPIILNPFEIGLVLIDDDNNPDSKGDNDDIIEAEEDVEIIPLLNNISENEYENVEGKLFALSGEIDIWNARTGATNVVYDHYPYNVIAGKQETVTSLQTNIMPEQDYVLSYRFNDTFSFPLIMQISAELPKYNDMEMRWAKEFILNDSYPNVGIDYSVPESYSLSNYPNPFNPSTTIDINLPINNNVRLDIFDVSGNLLVKLIDAYYEAGHYLINFDAGTLPSGIYIYRLSSNNMILSNKMLLMK